MKKLLLLTGLFILSIGSSALFARNNEISSHNNIQILKDTLPDKNDTAKQILNKEDKSFETVIVDARFPGGAPGWRNYIITNLNSEVPAKNNAPVGTYTIIAQFIVDTAGTVINIKPLTNDGYGMEAEVVRILQQSSKWEPALRNGRPIKSYRKQPVTFVVQQKGKRNSP